MYSRGESLVSRVDPLSGLGQKMAVSLNWLQFVSFEEIFACGRKTISVISKSSFESLVRHSDMGILWNGCVFVIHQCGWLVMKATKPIVVNSYVCWKNEHQTFLSLPAFLASQEAVLVLWYMCLVQLTIIIFLCVCVWSSYFQLQRRPFICISFFDVW